jgi:hypothetical protein
MKPSQYSAAALAAAFLFLVPGCSKKESPEASGESAATTEGAASGPAEGAAQPGAKPEPIPKGALPGASDVRSALASKDYSGAVERLIALRGLAAGDNAYTEYKALVYEIGRGLEEAAQTDPKAREALAQYSAHMVGR